ncbi:MAG TPA: alpha/beta hydrolase, partial [Acidimicrobiia bacterium]|nr:alpha/beta hydrolase [Acidimicrobiia bacterium]
MTDASSMSRVAANGIDFAYLEAGPADGPLALCLHGFPDHAPTFTSLLDALGEAGFHAVAPWMRGYHPTALAADGNYELAALATDAVALADALAGDGDAVLVGHDWGAAAAYAAGAYRPDRFRRMVTMAVPPGPAVAGAFLTRPDQLKRSWYMFFFQHPLSELAVPNDDFAFIDMLWRDWSPGYSADAGYMRGIKDAFAQPGGLNAALGYYRAMLNPSPDPDPALADARAVIGGPVRVPTLYLQGGDDQCMSHDLVDEAGFASAFDAEAVYEVVPGAGHFLHLEQPDRVEARIVEWLTA